MIKRASLAGDVAEALRLRGVHDPAAILTDDAGITVFAVAFERWVVRANRQPLQRLVASRWTNCGPSPGLVTIAQGRALPPGVRSQRSIGSLAFGDPELLVAADTRAVEVLRLPAFVRIGRAVVVDVRGRPLGMLSVTDVQRTLRARDLVAA